MDPRLSVIYTHRYIIHPYIFLRRLIIFDLGWLSPELYLRRPPSKNEQYRLDRMLQAAAQRGVRVNVIVYKEVTQAMTCKYSIFTQHISNVGRVYTNIEIMSQNLFLVVWQYRLLTLSIIWRIFIQTLPYSATQIIYLIGNLSILLL